MTTQGVYGVAHYSRKCPLCHQYIFAGGGVARRRMGGRFVWVHQDCYMPARLEREIKRLDREFNAIATKICR